MYWMCGELILKSVQTLQQYTQNKKKINEMILYENLYVY